MDKKLVLAIVAIVGLVVFAAVDEISKAAEPSFSAFTSRGTSLSAGPMPSGKIVVGVEAQGDSLDIHMGFVPSFFECWTAPNDSTAAAKHFVWFKGMKAGTVLTGVHTHQGVTAKDSIMEGGVTVLSGTAADTTLAWNRYITPPSTVTQIGATSAVLHTGVRLGAACVQDTLLFWRATP